MLQHQTRRAPLNTGWACGACGEGKRISIRDTRAMRSAKSCPGADAFILGPRETWEDKAAHRRRQVARHVQGTRCGQGFCRAWHRVLHVIAGGLLLLPLETKCLNLWSLVSFFFSEVAPNSKCIVDQMVEC